MSKLLTTLLGAALALAAAVSMASASSVQARAQAQAQAQARAQAQTQTATDKVFTYLGTMPVKEASDVVGAPKDAANQTLDTELSEDEQNCWNLIKDRSEVTFALQAKVLDELESELQKLEPLHESAFSESLAKNIAKMRKHFAEALAGIGDESPDDFFDALFNSSEDIIQLSASARNPKIPDGAFLVLVKAVSRLGRNNAALIQEFTDMCSFRKLAPLQPRLALAAIVESPQ